MKCDKEKIIEWLNGQLSKVEQQELQVHLDRCEGCRQELEQAKKLLLLMEGSTVPPPAVDMELRFQTTLRNYKESQQRYQVSHSGFWHGLYHQLTTKPLLQFGYSLLLLLIGTAITYVLMKKPASDQTGTTLAKLSEEIKDMKQAMMLTLIENPSATERMKAVSYAPEIGDADNRVTEALLTTLNEDLNINVRLVALDALVKYSGNPSVREGLIRSISRQQSPLVQAALADVMMKLREKRSVEPLRKLLQKDGATNPAQPKIKKAITALSA